MKWLERMTKPDKQTETWVSRARTPETRARIRRWSRWESIGMLVMVPGIIGISIGPFVITGIVIWFAVARIDRVDVYWWYGGMTLGSLAIGLTLTSIADRRRVQALYAGGYVTVGRIDDVITRPGSGDDPTYHSLVVSAELPGPVTIRRRLGWGTGDDPRRLIGRRIRFRHNTLDPDDLYDALDDGFPEQDEKVQRS